MLLYDYTTIISYYLLPSYLSMERGWDEGQQEDSMYMLCLSLGWGCYSKRPYGDGGEGEGWSRLKGRELGIGTKVS